MLAEGGEGGKCSAVRLVGSVAYLMLKPGIRTHVKESPRYHRWLRLVLETKEMVAADPAIRKSPDNDIVVISI